MKFERTIDKLIKHNIIKSEEADIYSYGLEITMIYLINLIISASISMFIHGLFIYVCFLVTFLPLRRVAGGFHFNNSIMCQFFSQLIVLLPQLIIPLLYKDIFIICFLPVFVLLICINYKKGSIASKNRYSDELLILKFTKKALYIEIIFIVIFILTTLFKFYFISYTLLYDAILQLILLLIPEQE